MDQGQERQINEAAEKFAGAITESYRMVSERAVSAQELNAELTQSFFNGVISNLRNQAESNRQSTEQLADQQQRQREATQALTQESVNAYMAFVNSMFSYYQGNIEQVQRQAEQTQRQVSEAALEAPEPDSGGATGSQTSEAAVPDSGSDTGSEGASGDVSDVESLLENYDSLNIPEVSEKLDDLSVEELQQLRDYEVQNKNRSTLVERLDAKIEAES